MENKKELEKEINEVKEETCFKPHVHVIDFKKVEEMISPRIEKDYFSFGDYSKAYVDSYLYLSNKCLEDAILNHYSKTSALELYIEKLPVEEQLEIYQKSFYTMVEDMQNFYENLEIKECFLSKDFEFYVLLYEFCHKYLVAQSNEK